MPRFVVYAFSVFLLLFAMTAWGQGSFRIGDIQVEGVQRLQPGAVLTYLPLRVGDTLTEKKSQQAIRALYDTGLFKNVSLSREGNTLVVKVSERPEIASFDISGNKRIGKNKLKDILQKQGLAKGELFRSALLDQVVQQLRTQYYANGFYSVRINPDITKLPNNRVAIDVKVTEGPMATIKDINIVGNKSFSDERLKDDVFTLEEHKPFYAHLLTFWRTHDKYSRHQLLGDLESLNSFYQDHGYIRFNVASVQVSLSPDKRDIFITINVDEGEQYTIGNYQFAGDMIVPQTSVERQVKISKGQIFKRSEVTASADGISSVLADFGYAFAKVDPITKIDDKDDTVDLTFYIKPGKRTYVRRVKFSGNEQTNDKTLRREMRQMEGAPFSSRSVERSRTRLARLEFIQDVDVKTEPVAGSDDLVDVDFDVEERPAGKLQFGIGYSDAEGVLLNGSVTQSNVRGTGNTLNLSAQTTDYAKSVSGYWLDPYFTKDGVSRRVSAYYRNVNQLAYSSSGLNMKSFGTAMTFGIPISEYSSLRLGVGLDRNRIIPDSHNSDEVKQFVKDNGTTANTLELRTGWKRDTRDRSYFATRGTYTALNFDFKVPGSDLEYYKASLEHIRYFRIGDWLPFMTDRFVLSMDGNIAYTDNYGKGTDVPPYARLFAGGSQSVRGFSSGGLGKRDSNGNAYGGKFLTTLQTELAIPTPFESDGKTTRLALFYDIGTVFNNTGDFDVSKLSSSAGVAFYWFTPFFGLLRVSYAPYVNRGRPHDEVDRFQFSFGIGF